MKIILKILAVQKYNDNNMRTNIYAELKCMKIVG